MFIWDALILHQDQWIFDFMTSCYKPAFFCHVSMCKVWLLVFYWCQMKVRASRLERKRIKEESTFINQSDLLMRQKGMLQNEIVHSHMPLLPSLTIKHKKEKYRRPDGEGSVNTLQSVNYRSISNKWAPYLDPFNDQLQLKDSRIKSTG